MIVTMNPERLIPLTCPSCGGAMEIQPTTDRVHCPYCGSLFLVPDMAQTEALREVATKVDQVAGSSVRLTLELELSRRERKLLSLEKRVEGIAHDRDRGWGAALMCLCALTALVVWGWWAALLGFLVGILIAHTVAESFLAPLKKAQKTERRRIREIRRSLEDLG